MSEMVKVANKALETKKDNSVSQKKTSDLSQSLNYSVDHILFLQRNIGNRAVQRLISSGALRTKLKIGRPGDVYEQEADRVAEQVISTPVALRSFSGHALSVQRTALEGELRREPEDEDEAFRAKRMEDTPQEANENLESRIQSLRGGGQPLPESVRTFFEPRFGQDFSQVRVHTDSHAAESARSINALAYTVGQDVVFGAGQYSPESGDGKKLIAHELTHVVQQNSDIPMRIYRAEAPDAKEREFWLSVGYQPHYEPPDRSKRTPMASVTGNQQADEILWTAEALLSRAEKMRTFLKSKFGDDKYLRVTSVVKEGEHTSYRKMDVVPSGTTKWEELAAAAVDAGFWVHAEGINLGGKFWPLSPKATGAHFDLYLIKLVSGDFPIPEEGGSSKAT